MTGEHRTAQTIMKLAAETLKRCSFECGGKAPISCQEQYVSPLQLME